MKKRKSISDNQLIQAIHRLDVRTDKHFKEQLANAMTAKYSTEPIELPSSAVEKWLGKIILGLLLGSNLLLLFINSFQATSVYLSVPIILFVGLFWLLILLRSWFFRYELENEVNTR